MLGDPHLLSLTQCDFVSRIALVRMQFDRTLARSPTAPAGQAQRQNGVDRRFELLGVVDIGARDGHGEWQTMPVHHDMTLRA